MSRIDIGREISDRPEFISLVRPWRTPDVIVRLATSASARCRRRSQLFYPAIIRQIYNWYIILDGYTHTNYATHFDGSSGKKRSHEQVRFRVVKLLRNVRC